MGLPERGTGPQEFTKKESRAPIKTFMEFKRALYQQGKPRYKTNRNSIKRDESGIRGLEVREGNHEGKPRRLGEKKVGCYEDGRVLLSRTGPDKKAKSHKWKERKVQTSGKRIGR